MKQSAPQYKVLAPCPMGCTDEDDEKQYTMAFKEGDRPQPVMREVTHHLIERNEKLLADRQFHNGLLFRLGVTDQIVTLGRDEHTGDVNVMSLDSALLSVVAADRFCFLSGKNHDKHKPVPPWFVVDLKGRNRSRLPTLDGVVKHPALRVDPDTPTVAQSSTRRIRPADQGVGRCRSEVRQDDRRVDRVRLLGPRGQGAVRADRR